MNIPILPLDQTDTHVPTQADGKSPLQILGKAVFYPMREKITLKFEGYVTKDLQSPILCGASFLERNKIVQELHNRRIIIEGKHYFEETSPFCPNPVPVVDTTSLTFNQVNFIESPEVWEVDIGSTLQDGDYIIAPTVETPKIVPQINRSQKGKLPIYMSSNQYEVRDEETPLIKIQPVQHLQ